MNQYDDNNFHATWRHAKDYVRLYAENLKLLSIEKATLLLSGATLAVVLLLFVVIAFFFISFGLIMLMAQAMPLMWCFMVMGGVYLLLGVIAFLVRRQLFVDPIARFISRVFIDNPDYSDYNAATGNVQPQNSKK